jgi:hypothetical protein
MPIKKQQKTLARLMKSIESVLDQYKDITWPLDEVTNRSLLRSVRKFTRLYQLPEDELGKGLARSTRLQKLRVRKLLLAIPKEYGPTVVFLCSQAALETQLGRLSTDAVLEEFHLWYQKVRLPKSLEEVAKHLLDESRCESTEGPYAMPISIFS